MNGLHGRAIPVASAVRMANHEIPVIAIGGDGDMYGEGGNHFLHAIRRNVNITVMVHNNKVFGLTQGQASPTTDLGIVTKVQTHGVFSTPMNPLAVAAVLEAAFAARGYTGNQPQLVDLIKKAIEADGFSLLRHPSNHASALTGCTPSSGTRTGFTIWVKTAMMKPT